MTREMIVEVKKAIRHWAEQHPTPDAVVFHSAKGFDYSPLQLAEEVDQETAFGALQLRVIEQAVEDKHKLEEILSSLYKTHEVSG